MQNSQHSESWSELNTVTTIDAGSTVAVGEMSNSDVVVHDVKHVSTTSLLVESLIEQLCKLLEKDTVKQKNIYHVICGKLHQMNLIDKSYGIEEFEFIRTHYQRELMKFLSIAKSTVNGNESQNVLQQYPSHTVELTRNLFYQEFSLQSRYLTDYEELEYLAKGGFGEVYKARNKLDGGVYAIKKIYVCYHNTNYFLQTLREVKLLARLNHPNMVTYKAAWLEPLNSGSDSGSRKFAREHFYSGISTIYSENSRKEVLSPVESDEDSGGIVFRDSRSEHSRVTEERVSSGATSSNVRIFSKQRLRIVTDTNHSILKSRSELTEDISEPTKESAQDCDGGDTSSSGSFSRHKAVCTFKWNEGRFTSHPYPFRHQQLAILYIQMQLCECTLRQWMDERNSLSQSVDVKQSLAIFDQIVRGVEYIHSQGIVHHDIKPSNIFVNRDVSQVQVGDLGLACFFHHSTPDVTVMNQASCTLDHKGGVGTKLYAAPEQLKGECTPKSDIYSLGIVLFELLQPFSTNMERIEVLTQLKTDNIPLDMYPELVQLIKDLVSSNTATRPTAGELLTRLQSLKEVLSHSRSNCDNADETIRQLRADLCEKNREIEELKRRVQALELCK